MGLLLEMLKLPPWLQAWVLWMGAVNMLAVVFWRYLEARFLLAGFGTAFLVMNLLYTLNGFTRLLGLAHLIGWIPPLVYLYVRRNRISPERWYRLWIKALVVTNVVSLVVDAIDVYRYVAGI